MDQELLSSDPYEGLVPTGPAAFSYFCFLFIYFFCFVFVSTPFHSERHVALAVFIVCTCGIIKIKVLIGHSRYSNSESRLAAVDSLGGGEVVSKETVKGANSPRGSDIPCSRANEHPFAISCASALRCVVV